MSEQQHSDPLGSWILDPNDSKSISAFGDIRITFQPDGKATYLINTEDDKQQIIFVTYKVDGDMLITNQPTQPKEEISTFRLNDDGSLSISFEGYDARFIRG